MPLSDRTGVSGLAASAATIAILWLVRLAPSIDLPRDAEYEALLALMWSGSQQWLPMVYAVFLLIQLVAGSSAVLYLIAKLVRSPSLVRIAPSPGLVAGAGLYVLSTHLLGRIGANIIYSIRGPDRPFLESVLAEVEGPMIVALQQASSSAIQHGALAVYSVVWLMLLIVCWPLALSVRDPRLSLEVLAGPFIVTALALPIHAVIPVHDPWTFNPTYGRAADVRTAVELLVPSADSLGPLVVSEMPTVVASGLPSLHIALPAFMALAFWRSGRRAAGAAIGGVTLTVAIATVLLGRHWIVDAVGGALVAGAAVLLLQRFLGRATAHEDTTGP